MNRTIRPLARRVILPAGMVICIAASAIAQGSVQGLVRDDDGNGISSATVMAENITSDRSHTLTTDNAGRFSFIVMRRGEWRFLIRADGFEPTLGSASVRRSNSDIRVQFTMEWDRFNPQAPETGLLAGLTARDLIESLDVADALVARGNLDAAIDAYRSILERAPDLTSLGLQIGHAFREQQKPDRALAAFRAVLDADPSNAEARMAIDAINQTVR